MHFLGQVSCRYVLRFRHEGRLIENLARCLACNLPLQSAAEIEAWLSVVVPWGQRVQLITAAYPDLYSPLGQGATWPGPFRK
jgi:hypothetical protein